MSNKLTEEEKAEAMQEYRSNQQAAIDRIDGLKAARIARDTAEKRKAKPKAKAG